jgi:hypothetical protein
MRARVMPYNGSNRSAEQDRVRPEPAVGPAFGSIMLGARNPDFAALHPGYKSKEAERRQAHVFRWSASADAARALTRRARLTAFHRGTCGREPTPPLSSRTRFLGRGILQALPEGDLSQSSDKVADRSSCGPGVFPKAARERR